MKNPLFAISVCALVLSLAAFRAPQQATVQITQAELVQHTQELVDAVAPGNREPWQKYFADDVMFFDERGRNMNKQALIADITPMPTGYSGNIRVIKPQSHIEGNVAILSYDMDETEIIYGQTMKARYHSTDTWMFRQGKWQITAVQVLRYYEDPAPGKPNTARFADYLGTYELAPGITMVVTVEGEKLFNQRNGRAKEELIPEASDIFFRKGVEGRRLFHYNDAGKVDALIDRRSNEDVVWKKMK